MSKEEAILWLVIYAFCAVASIWTMWCVERRERKFWKKWLGNRVPVSKSSLTSEPS